MMTECTFLDELSFRIRFWELSLTRF